MPQAEGGSGRAVLRGWGDVREGGGLAGDGRGGVEEAG